jgi:hypothetical protein
MVVTPLFSGVEDDEDERGDGSGCEEQRAVKAYSS